MKKYLFCFIVCLITHNLSAAYKSNTLPVNNSSNILLKPTTLDHDKQILFYALLNHFSARQYQKLKGKKLMLIEKVNYFLIKYKFKKIQSSDSAIAGIGGFCLGFLFGSAWCFNCFLSKKKLI